MKTKIGSKIVGKARAAEAGAHVLKIISLFDAQATCSCGGWNLTATGEYPRATIERAFNRHKEQFL